MTQTVPTACVPSSTTGAPGVEADVAPAGRPAGCRRTAGRPGRPGTSSSSCPCDRVRAERQVAVGLVEVEPDLGLEPLPVRVDQADQPHRGAADLRGEQRDVVEVLLRAGCRAPGRRAGRRAGRPRRAGSGALTCPIVSLDASGQRRLRRIRGQTAVGTRPMGRVPTCWPPVRQRPIATGRGDLCRTHPVGCLTQLSPGAARACAPPVRFPRSGDRRRHRAESCATRHPVTLGRSGEVWYRLFRAGHCRRDNRA